MARFGGPFLSLGGEMELNWNSRPESQAGRVAEADQEFAKGIDFLRDAVFNSDSAGYLILKIPIDVTCEPECLGFINHDPRDQAQVLALAQRLRSLGQYFINQVIEHRRKGIFGW